jgi:hypothetical protein
MSVEFFNERSLGFFLEIWYNGIVILKNYNTIKIQENG